MPKWMLAICWVLALGILIFIGAACFNGMPNPQRIQKSEFEPIDEKMAGKYVCFMTEINDKKWSSDLTIQKDGQFVMNFNDGTRLSGNIGTWKQRKFWGNYKTITPEGELATIYSEFKPPEFWNLSEGGDNFSYNCLKDGLELSHNGIKMSYYKQIDKDALSEHVKFDAPKGFGIGGESADESGITGRYYTNGDIGYTIEITDDSPVDMADDSWKHIGEIESQNGIFELTSEKIEGVTDYTAYSPIGNKYIAVEMTVPEGREKECRKAIEEAVKNIYIGE